MNGVVRSGSKSRLLGYVCSLRYCRGPDFDVGYRMRDLPQGSGEYLSAMPNLHSLTLSRIRVERIGEEGFRTCFSAFRGTLTYLSLDVFATSFGAFVTLVDYFPNLRSLLLRSFRLEPDEGPVPPLSRPLKGKVHFCDVTVRGLEFFDLFSKLDLEYEELIIDRAEMRCMERALQIGTSTVKFLRLTSEIPRVISPHALSKPCLTQPSYTQVRDALRIRNFQVLANCPLLDPLLFRHLDRTPEGHLPSGSHARSDDCQATTGAVGCD